MFHINGNKVRDEEKLSLAKVLVELITPYRFAGESFFPSLNVIIYNP